MKTSSKSIMKGLWLIVVVIILWICFSTSETLTLGKSWELEPQWELCAPCFAQCSRQQWKGKLQPHIGETNKDMCARLCSSYCQGFAYRWPDSIHIGFQKHGI